MQSLHIYLAGNIRKGPEESCEDVWTEGEMMFLEEHSQRELIFLNPASGSDDLSDQKSVFGRDLFQVYSSNLVLVDARSKRGLGVGAEMMFAKMNCIPVVAWLPYPSHYHRDSIHLLGQDVNAWIHPFVYNLCDFLAPSLQSAVEWMNTTLSSPAFRPKGPEVLTGAIRHYLSTQLPRDEGMRSLVASSPYYQGVVDTLRCCHERKKCVSSPK